MIPFLERKLQPKKFSVTLNQTKTFAKQPRSFLKLHLEQCLELELELVQEHFLFFELTLFL